MCLFILPSYVYSIFKSLKNCITFFSFYIFSILFSLFPRCCPLFPLPLFYSLYPLVSFLLLYSLSILPVFSPSLLLLCHLLHSSLLPSLPLHLLPLTSSNSFTAFLVFLSSSSFSQFLHFFSSIPPSNSLIPFLVLPSFSPLPLHLPVPSIIQNRLTFIPFFS